MRLSKLRHASLAGDLNLKTFFIATAVCASILNPVKLMPVLTLNIIPATGTLSSSA